MDRVLQTLRRHLSGLDDEVCFSPAQPSRTQTHRFGEGMKAVNELVGYLQVLNSRLGKLHNVVAKLEFSTESGQQSSASINTREILLSQARDLIAGTKFVDKDLFDVELNASMGGFTVSFEMANPSKLLEDGEFAVLIDYIVMKREEIVACMKAIKALSEQDVSSVSYDCLKGKTVGQALKSL